MTHPHETPAFGILLSPTEEALEAALGERARARALVAELVDWLMLLDDGVPHDFDCGYFADEVGLPSTCTCGFGELIERARKP